MKSLAIRCPSLALAVWLLGAPVVSKSTAADNRAAPQASTEWRTPHSVDNPFVTAKPSAKPPFPGEVVDGELPVVYRLPPLPPPEDGKTVIGADAGADVAANDSAPADILVAPRLITPALPPTIDSSAATAGEPSTHAEHAPHERTDPSTIEEALATGDRGYALPDFFLDEPRIPLDVVDGDGIHSRPIATETSLYTPSTIALSSQLMPAVQRGYALAQRGAMFAAQTEFIGVLRRIAQAKDAERGTDQHGRALAEGLRALDEAEDFVPSGNQLEAEVDVRIVASSHRTPVLRDRHESVLPRQAAALYHSYAQQRLTLAVDGEQAGSMVLHGLGKAKARLAERDGDLHAAQSAMTMYQAALAAGPSNHLAANELGVLLCRNGHAGEAARLFERAIDVAPTATAYHNLAVAQQNLGLHAHAAANQQEAQRLAALERASGALSQRAGVEWVSPDQMVGVPPSKPSRWQRTKELAKALPRPGARSTENTAPAAPPAGSATQWR